jgi:signal transduction histidine kinase
MRLLFFLVLFLGVLIKDSRFKVSQHLLPSQRSKAFHTADSLLNINPGKSLSILKDEFQDELDTIPEVWLLKAQAMDILEKNDEALELLSRLTDSTNKNIQVQIRSLAWYEYGKILYYQGQYNDALKVFTDIETSYRPMLDSSQLGWILLFRGKALRVLGQYQSSQECYREAKTIASRFNDPSLMAIALISTGKNHIVEGNLELALNDYLEAYKISEPLSDYLLFGDVCNHLGGYYLTDKQFDKALEYHQKALKYRLILGAPDEIGQSYNNIGRVFLEQGMTDSAEFYFQQSVTLFTRSHYMKGLIKGLSNLGKVYMNRKMPTTTKKYLSKAHGLALQSGYQLGMCETGIAMADFFLSQHNPDSAIAFYQQSLTLLQTSSYDEYLADVYRGLYDAYKLKDDYQQALYYHEKLLESETNRLNVENKRQMTSLLLNFDYERKEKDNHILVKENELKTLTIKRNHLIIWFTTIGLMVFVLLSFLIYNRLKYKEKANKMLRVLNDRIVRQNRELELLNNSMQKAGQEKDKLFSIISHELRNPLYWFHNLTAMLSKNYKTMDEAKLSKSIASLNESAQNVYHLMDNLLFWSRAQLNRIMPRKSKFILNDKLDDVFHTFKTIIDSKEINCKVNIPDKVKIVADADLLACIIRNLLSNAIKYTPDKGNITLEVIPQTNKVMFCLSDTGNGFPYKSFEDMLAIPQPISMPGMLNEKGSGLGLKLCKDFVEMHQGKIWVDAHETSGCRICFTIWQKN